MDPEMVIVDHNNEETVAETLNRGFWAGFSIYPNTKMESGRMVEILQTYGGDRIIIDSACDWGVSNPLAVPKTAQLAIQNGVSKEVVEKVCYKNALHAYGQRGQFNEIDWLNPPDIDRRTLFSGNSIVRGGLDPD